MQGMIERFRLTNLFFHVAAILVVTVSCGQVAQADAIHVATLHNDDDALYDLIRSDPASVNAENEDGDRPLHIAAKRLHREALIRLLNANADYEAKDRAGHTALHLALKAGTDDQESTKRRLDAVQVLLLQGASTETTDARGWTALHYAAAYGRFAVLESLRGIGAKLDATDDLGRTAVHLAAQRGEVGVLKWLHSMKLDISARDKQGFTPLLCAAGRAQVESVKRLLEFGASATEVADDGRTMLHVLSEADLDDEKIGNDAEVLVTIAVSHGVKTDAKDKKERTAADLAKERKFLKLANWIKAEGKK